VCTSWLVDDLISRIWTRSTGLIHQWYLPISAMICPRHAAMLKTDRASLSTVNLPGGDVRTRGMPPGRIAKSNHLINSQRSASSARGKPELRRTCPVSANQLGPNRGREIPFAVARRRRTIRSARQRREADHSPPWSDPACIRCTIRSSGPMRVPVGTGLLQFATRSVAHSRAGPPPVVGCQRGNSSAGRTGLDDIPEDVLGDTVAHTVPFLRIERNSLPLPIVALSAQRSTAVFTRAGTGTVRKWPALPTRSTIAQRSSRL
jgi:hypothetical protein